MKYLIELYIQLLNTLNLGNTLYFQGVTTYHFYKFIEPTMSFQDDADAYAQATDDAWYAEQVMLQESESFDNYPPLNDKDLYQLIVQIEELHCSISATIQDADIHGHECYGDDFAEDTYLLSELECHYAHHLHTCALPEDVIPF